ncbi:MAG: hypothetical protein AB8F78_04325 [Saprospiraceae bacterium]
MRSYVALVAGCLLSLLTVGCEVLPDVRPVPEFAFGLVPKYIDSLDGKTITTSTPEDILDGRAFAVLGDTLFIVDHLRGIHIIDNRDPGSPEAISFITIPGCTSVAINGNFLYVNNLSDLVTLDITDPLNALPVDREEGLYPLPLDFPEEYVGYYGCYDPARGYLIGWEQDQIEQPECYIE